MRGGGRSREHVQEVRCADLGHEGGEEERRGEEGPPDEELQAFPSPGSPQLERGPGLRILAGQLP
ncbi:MAG: hypothetical protein ACUVS5_13730, partial [Anaerolineae bacterium]